MRWRLELILGPLLLLCVSSQDYHSLYSSSDPQLKSPISDFSQFPGHLKQFGSFFPRIKVQKNNGFVDTPQSFYEKYVEGKKPAVFHKISNDFYRQTQFRPKLADMKNSGRQFLSFLTTLDGSVMSLYDYLTMIGTESNPVVSFIPQEIKTEIELPSILKDVKIIEKLTSTLHIISNSTRAFPLRESLVNRIVCQIEGTKEVLLIDKANDFQKFDLFAKRISEKYDNHPGDIIDYSRVDYEEFQELLDVQKFHIAKLESDSCLFIPSHWIFQATSIEFDHSFEIHFEDVKNVGSSSDENTKLPQIMTLYDCPWPNEGLHDRPPVKSNDRNRISLEKVIHIIDKYILNQAEPLDIKHFIDAIKTDTKVIEYTVHGEWINELVQEVNMLYGTIDVNEDHILSSIDFHGLEQEVMDDIRDRIFFILISISEISYDLRIDSLGPIEGKRPTLDIERLIQSEEAESKRKYFERLKNGHSRVNSKDEL